MTSRKSERSMVETVDDKVALYYAYLLSVQLPTPTYNEVS